VRKRGKNSWAVVVDLGRDPGTGERRRLWRSVKGTKRDAEALLVQLLHERDLGIDERPARLTVGEFLERWLTDVAATNTAPKTYRTDCDVVRRHVIPAMGALQLAKLRPQQIQAYYARCLASGRLDGKGGLSPRSVVRHHQVLHAVLRQAVKWQLLARNPADAAVPPRGERRGMRVLNPEEVQRLFAAADATPYGAVVRLAVYTSLRQGEVLGLRWRDLDLDGGSLHVQQTVQSLPGRGVFFRQPKSAKSRRAVALSPDTASLLREHHRRQAEERLRAGSAYEDQDLVFATAIGRPIDPSNLRRAWRGIVKRAAIGHLRFHDLRHTHASMMLKQGVHLKVVSERLGHASIAITADTYSHVLPGLQAAAAAQFDGLLRGDEAAAG
jgi:integrase